MTAKTMMASAMGGIHARPMRSSRRPASVLMR